VDTHLAKSTLYEISGHLGWYAEGMYPPMEMRGRPTTPSHELPDAHPDLQEPPTLLPGVAHPAVRVRHGISLRAIRVLNGLLRVRGITQDDSHIFCSPDQLAPELADLLTFVLKILREFGLTEFEAELSTRPEKFVGRPEEWDQATDALRHALAAAELPYVVAEGEGAFYAPKIDVHVRDAIGRRWQVSTLQVDLQMPHASTWSSWGLTTTGIGRS